MPRTTLRAFRLDDEHWTAVQALAKQYGISASELLRRAIVATLTINDVAPTPTAKRAPRVAGAKLNHED